jgi:hypothetical protein
MRHIHLLILVGLMGSCVFHPKDPVKTVSVPNDANGLPAFEMNEKIHNFGTLQSGEIAVYSFIYRNAGTGNLEIVKIETGCSCLTVEPVEKLVKSGDSGTIKVIFNTSGLYGKQFQSCRLFSSREGITMDIAVAAEVVNEEIKFKQP